MNSSAQPSGAAFIVSEQTRFDGANHRGAKLGAQRTRVLDCAAHPWTKRYPHSDLNRLCLSSDTPLGGHSPQGWMDFMDGYSFAMRSSRLSAIKAFIVSEIDNPALCLADIAAHQGISSSYVRKLFAAEGTRFTAFVLETRLEYVSRILLDPDNRAQSISAIALKCGFNDISYFNRVFRRRYGCTPSDLRRGRSEADPVESATA